MRQDTGVDGDAQRISQLVWMLFLKIYDDHEKELEMLDEKYKSPIPKNLRWREWAENDEGITGDGLLKFINNDLFEGLKGLSTTGKQGERAKLVKDIFEDSYNYMKSGNLIRQVINKINEMDFTKSSDRHVFNDIYEKILKDLQSAGNSGEIYTPRPLTEFMTEMVNPKLGEKVLDIASGTGGFLVSTIEHIKRNGGEDSLENRQILQNTVIGFEKKPLPHSLATTNLILHAIEIPKVIRGNTLGKALKEYSDKDYVDVVLTNPPFGGIEEDNISKSFSTSFQTKETADMFMLLVIEILRDGGRAAIVLPDGFLFGEGVKTRIKERLLEKCNLHTIVRLPNGVFSPYTGITTNLLFFTKGEKTKDIWYFEHPYPEGTKSYSKTRPIQVSEFQLEKKWWNKRKENDYAWKVSVKDLKNFNLDIKNPNGKKEEEILDRSHILSRMKENQNEISKFLKELSV